MKDNPLHTDPTVALSQKLIACQSVTPKEAGCFQVIAQHLADVTSPHMLPVCERFTWTQNPGTPGAYTTDNLFIRFGQGAPHLMFAGHIDVVPTGPLKAWTHPPFQGAVVNDILWGRGVADMKGAVAAFAEATRDFLSHAKDALTGSISLLITSDEEGDAKDGIQRVIPWLKEHHHIPDACLIGEPTSIAHLGDTIKIGRRGSTTGVLDVHGRQGHIAYPDLADNPIPRLLQTARALLDMNWDDGMPPFEPSGLQITSLDVGNPTTNIIPGTAQLRFGIRFNPHHTHKAIAQRLHALCEAYAGTHTLELTEHGPPYLTRDQHWIETVSQAVSAECGKAPKLCAGGGTSDGRFLATITPVIELGLCEATIHQVDEQAPCEDLKRLTRIYRHILKRFLG